MPAATLFRWLERGEALLHARPAHRNRRGYLRHCGTRRKVHRVWRESATNRARGVRINEAFHPPASCPTDTPFQWEAQNSREEYLRKVTLLRGAIKIARSPITGMTQRPARGCLLRGDRRIADVLEEGWRNGAKFDSWSEYFQLQRWLDAFTTCGLDPAFYANRVRDKDEILPWQVISNGVKDAYLWQEREACFAATITPDCRSECSHCGANRFCEGGVCHG